MFTNEVLVSDFFKFRCDPGTRAILISLAETHGLSESAVIKMAVRALHRSSDHAPLLNRAALVVMDAPTPLALPAKPKKAKAPKATAVAVAVAAPEPSLDLEAVRLMSSTWRTLSDPGKKAAKAEALEALVFGAFEGEGVDRVLARQVLAILQPLGGPANLLEFLNNVLTTG